MSAPYGYICGCYYQLPPPNQWSNVQKRYIAQISANARTTILASTSRTTLTQTFVNPSEHKAIKELSYSFPLYDGVSVVGFTCRIGQRTIAGEVKEKDSARAIYKDAKERGEVAGLLEQLPEASDVFITKLGNVPPAASIIVEITYLGELKHDAEVDGLRFTIPTFIAPRYGSYPSSAPALPTASATMKGFEVTVDAELEEGAYIREVRSPSHPIAVTLGTTSSTKEGDPQPNKASATLSLGSAELDKDFVLQVVAKEIAVPKAMLETHPTIPGQRALMATLVPKFALPPERPEIVFVCDRSGSMGGNKIVALRNALKVFLKSLPTGTKFNICSFGSHYTFLWERSNSYSETSVEAAMKHVETFAADYGGTEMFRPMEETIKRRYKDMNLEIFLVTDGEIWDQQRLFDLLNTEIGTKQAPIRVFTLGIGDAFSSSLIEGVARAGNGFSQAVGENEKLDGKVVRMLKAALTPHITDYTLEVRYADGSVDKTVEVPRVAVTEPAKKRTSVLKDMVTTKISLFDTSADPDKVESDHKDDNDQGKYAHLPEISPPNLLQAPNKIPPLFPFSRMSVYLLLSPSAVQSTPTTVVLRGTSKHGPLELEIPVQILQTPGQTIHQLAAKQAVHELEQSRGWLAGAHDAASGKLLKEKHEGRFNEFVEREAVRLGVEFQVGGKFCSFVAVEKKSGEDDPVNDADDWEFLDEEVEKLSLQQSGSANVEPGYVTDLCFSSTSGKLLRDRHSDVGSYPQDRLRKARGGLLFPTGRSRISFSRGSAQLPEAITSSRSSSSRAAPSEKPKGAPYGVGSSALMSVQNAGNHFATAYAVPPPAPRSMFGLMTQSAQQVHVDARQDVKEACSTPSIPSMLGRRRVSDDAEGKKKKTKAAVRAAPVADFMGPGSVRQLSRTDPLQALVDLQTFEGYWLLNEHLCAAVGAKVEAVTRAAQSYSIDTRVIATALAVHFLTTKLKAEEDSWELVVDKAKGWLEANGCGEGSNCWSVVAGLI